MVGSGSTIPFSFSAGFPVGPSLAQVKLLDLLVDYLESAGKPGCIVFLHSVERYSVSSKFKNITKKLKLISVDCGLSLEATQGWCISPDLREAP